VLALGIVGGIIEGGEVVSSSHVSSLGLMTPAANNKIFVRVPKAIVGSPDEDSPWWVTVLIGSDDAGSWRKVAMVERSNFCIRWMPEVDEAALEAQSMALLKEVEPRVMDILVPDWTTQKEVLGTYETEPPAYAGVYADGPLPRSPYFTIVASPASGIVQRGGLVQTTIEVKSFMGYDKSVTLSAQVPLGFEVEFQPSSGTPPFTSSMTVSTSEETPTGSKVLTVTATGPEGETKTCTYKLWVAEKLFATSDPTDDDYGPGTYTYPTDAVFQGKPGLFDITEFKFFTDEQNYYFAFTFEAERLGGNVWSGEAGFSFQLCEIWVDCKQGGETVPLSEEGPAVKIDADHPWDFGVQVTGFYKEHKAKRNWIAFAGQPAPHTDVITVESDLAAKTITVMIPKQVVIDNLAELRPEDEWYAVVLSGSQDGFSELWSWRQVYTEAERWQGGGADNIAFAAGVSPNVYDVLLPEGVEQSQILGGYNPDLLPPEGYAEVPAISLAGGSASEDGVPTKNGVASKNGTGTLLPIMLSGSTLLFEAEDPVDDDHGIGVYMYPENQEFVPGVFDLTYLKVYEDQDNNIVFELTFRNLGGNPWNAPHGFSLQLVEIYVNDGTGTETAPLPVSATDNENTAHVRIENAWKWALRANGWPRDHEGRYNTHGRWDNGSIFDIYVSAVVEPVEEPPPEEPEEVEKPEKPVGPDIFQTILPLAVIIVVLALVLGIFAMRRRKGEGPISGPT
jgi:carbohydrate-binding DOMON domain-containing protein